MGKGKGLKPPHHPRNRGTQIQQRRRGDDVRATSGGTAKPRAGHGGGQKSVETQHRHPDGADGARPDHGAPARCEYSLLAPV